MFSCSVRGRCPGCQDRELCRRVVLWKGGSGMSGPRGMFLCSVGGGSGFSGLRWMFSCEEGVVRTERGFFV